MFIWTFLLRITHTIISQSIADSSWITLYNVTEYFLITIHTTVIVISISWNYRGAFINQSISLHSFFLSFLWHVQKATIPCRSQELYPFLSVMSPFFPHFSTNQFSILPHFILLSISWSPSQPCFFSQFIYSNLVENFIFLLSLHMLKPK